MTISTTASTVTAAGNGASLAFNFGFVYDSAANIVVTFTDATGAATVLAQGSQYTLTLNPPAAGQIWGVGGTVTYPLSGAPIPAGTYLTISRALPLTQLITLANQGAFYPQVVERALDILEMQQQQASAISTRAITINQVDPGPAVPLPPAAIRANQYAFFDAQGNLTAGLPASSSAIISAAMQPVVAASSLSTARALLGTLGTFGTIAALRANAVTQPAVIYLTGYNAPADGGEGAFELVTSDTTSSDNGGTIIVDAIGNRWHRATEGRPWSILWFGGSGDGTTDNSAAWTALVAAVVLRPSGGRISFPAGGKYLFATQATFTFPAAIPVFALEIEAYGATLYWPNGSGGIKLVFSSPAHTIAFNGGRLTTGITGGGSAVSTTQSSPLSTFSQSSFSGMTFCGDDNAGNLGSKYWTICADIVNMSGVNFEACTFIGAGATSGDGVHFSGTGPFPGPNFGLGCLVTRCWFQELNVCFTPGAFQQAITINSSLLVNSTLGVLVPVEAAANLEMLTITGCDIECTMGCVVMLTNIPFVQISANLLVVGGATNASIWLPLCGGAQITGNYITANTNSGTVGALVGGGAGAAANTGGAVITGNTFANLGAGVDLGSFSVGCNVQSNIYVGCTTNTANAGTGNTIGGGSP